MAFNVCTVTFLNIKSFTNSYSRRFYWYIPGVPIKAEFIEQKRIDSEMTIKMSRLIVVKKILIQYELPDPESLLVIVLEKYAWKKHFHTGINKYWTERYQTYSDALKNSFPPDYSAVE